MAATTIKKLGEFVEYVEDFTNDDILLLRGYKCASWRLEPNLSRLTLRPGNTDRLVVERGLLDKFKREALPHLVTPPTNELGWLALAQHHGVRTRLLDWTASPLAALWFAVQEKREPGENGEVCMLIPKNDEIVGTDSKLDPFAVSKTVFLLPDHISPRIVAQQGWFSVHTYDPVTGKFHDLDVLPEYHGRIHRIEIPADWFDSLRWELDRMAFNEAVLFPGLDGLARHVNWLHSLAPGEPADPQGDPDPARTDPDGGIRSHRRSMWRRHRRTREHPTGQEHGRPRRG